MSKQKRGGHVRDLPLNEDGIIDFSKMPVDENGQTEIDRLADEAYEDGTLELMDILGNTEPYSNIEIPGSRDLQKIEQNIELILVLENLKHLQGKVLTVIDAVIENEHRTKYVKDIIKDQFSEKASLLEQISVKTK
jgi:hypothetical protein